MVEALRVDHAPVSPAVGYRFTYGGRTLLISGDTAQSDNIRRFAEGIDLLVHEALSPEIIGMMEDTAVSSIMPMISGESASWTNRSMPSAKRLMLSD